MNLPSRHSHPPRRGSPPSPASGRGLWISNTIGVFGISSLHSRHTKYTQNSLLPLGGRRVGDEGGITAGSSFNTVKSFSLTPKGKHNKTPSLEVAA
jgi:hypothetical protein